MAYWDGQRFHWTSPVTLFHSETQLTPLSFALLGGFLKAWERGAYAVDVYATKREFLGSNTWKQAAGGAITQAAAFYSTRKVQHFRVMVLSDVCLQYLLFFHRQFERIAKYSRRGLRILHFTEDVHFWIVYACISQVCRLPWSQN